MLSLKKHYQLLNSVKGKIAYKYFYKTLKVLINMLYPRLVSINSVGVDKESQFVISLTSFPKRIDTVWITITTLLEQRTKPYSIILWLSEEEFPNRIGDLPSSLLSLTKYGLEIKFCDNIYPHKKYYYSMKAYPDKNIVTVDDDIFYPEDMLEIMIEEYHRHNNCIICNWAHKITITNDWMIAPYDEWLSGVDDLGPALDLMPVGFGGVLYPSGLLPSEVFNKEVFMKCCPKTDDLWLKCMSTIAGIKTVRTNKPPTRFFSIIKTQKNALQNSNVLEKGNDKAIAYLQELYPSFLDNLKHHDI